MNLTPCKLRKRLTNVPNGLSGHPSNSLPRGRTYRVPPSTTGSADYYCCAVFDNAFVVRTIRIQFYWVYVAVGDKSTFVQCGTRPLKRLELTFNKLLLVLIYK